MGSVDGRRLRVGRCWLLIVVWCCCTIGGALATGSLGAPPDNPRCEGSIKLYGAGMYDMSWLQLLPQMEIVKTVSGQPTPALWISMCHRVSCPCGFGCSSNFTDSFIFSCGETVDSTLAFNGTPTLEHHTAGSPPESLLQLTFPAPMGGSGGPFTLELRCNSSAGRDPLDYSAQRPDETLMAQIWLGTLCPRTRTASATPTPTASPTASPAASSSHTRSAGTPSRTGLRSQTRSHGTDSPTASSSHTRSAGNLSRSPSASFSLSRDRSRTHTASIPPTSSRTTTGSDSTSLSRSSERTKSQSSTESESGTSTPSGTPSHSQSHTVTPSALGTASQSATHSGSVSANTNTRSATHSPPPTSTETISRATPSASSSLSLSSSVAITSSLTLVLTPTATHVETESDSFSLSQSSSATVSPPPTPTDSSSESTTLSVTITPPPTPTLSLSVSWTTSNTVSESMSGGTPTHPATATVTETVSHSESGTFSLPITATESMSVSGSSSASIRPATILNISDLIANHSVGVLANALPLPLSWELQVYVDGEGNLTISSLFPTHSRIPIEVARPIFVALIILRRADSSGNITGTVRPIAVSLVLVPTTNTTYVALIPLDTSAAPDDVQVMRTALEHDVPIGFEGHTIYEHTGAAVVVVGARAVHLVDTVSCTILDTVPLPQQNAVLSQFLVFPTEGSMLITTSNVTRLCSISIARNATVFSTRTFSCMHKLTAADDDRIILCTVSNSTHLDENPYDNRVFVASPNTPLGGIVQTAKGKVWAFLVSGWNNVRMLENEGAYFPAPLTRPAVMIRRSGASASTADRDDIASLGLRIVGVQDTVVRSPSFVASEPGNDERMRDLSQAKGAAVTIGPVVAASLNSSILLAANEVFFQLDSDLNIIEATNIGIDITGITVADPYPAAPGTEADIVFLSLEPNLVMPALLVPRAGAPSGSTRQLRFGGPLRLPGACESVVSAVTVLNIPCDVRVNRGRDDEFIVGGKTIVISSTSSTIGACYSVSQLTVDVKGVTPMSDSGHHEVKMRMIPGIIATTSRFAVRLSIVGNFVAELLRFRPWSRLWVTTKEGTPRLGEATKLLPAKNAVDDFMLYALSAATEQGARAKVYRLEAISLVGNGEAKWSVGLGEGCHAASSVMQLSGDEGVLWVFCVDASGVVTVHVVNATHPDAPPSHVNASFDLKKHTDAVDGIEPAAFESTSVVSVITQRRSILHAAASPLPPQELLGGAAFYRSIAILSIDVVLIIDIDIRHFGEWNASAPAIHVSILDVDAKANESGGSGGGSGGGHRAKDLELAADGEAFFLLTSQQLLAFDLFPSVKLLWGSSGGSGAASSSTCDTSAAFHSCSAVVEDGLCRFGGPCNVILHSNAGGALEGFSTEGAGGAGDGKQPLRPPTWRLTDRAGGTASRFFEEVAAHIIHWRSRLFIFSSYNWSVTCYHHMHTTDEPTFEWSARLLDSSVTPNVQENSPFGRSNADVESHMAVSQLGVLFAVLRIRAPNTTARATQETSPEQEENRFFHYYSVAIGLDAISGEELWRILPVTIAHTAADLNGVPATFHVQRQSFAPDPSKVAAIWNENVHVAQLTTPDNDASDRQRDTLLTSHVLLGIDLLEGTVLFQVPMNTRRNETSDNSHVRSMLRIHALRPLDWSSGNSGAPRVMQLIVAGGFCYDVEVDVHDPLLRGRIVGTTSPKGSVATCMWSFDVGLFPTGMPLLAPALVGWQLKLDVPLQLFQFVGSLLHLPATWRPSNGGPWEGVTIADAGEGGGGAARLVGFDVRGMQLRGVLNWSGVPAAAAAAGSAGSSSTLSTATLQLSQNALSGYFRASFVSNCTDLRVLDVSDNAFSGSFETFAGLPPHLTHVVLGKNMLRASPSLLSGDASALSSLTALQRLSSVEVLDVSDSLLGAHGISFEFLSFLPLRLRSLRFSRAGFECPLFSLRRNSSGAPTRLHAPALNLIDVSHNSFIGDEISTLRCEELPSGLAVLDISSNNFAAPAPSIFRRVDLTGNTSSACMLRSFNASGNLFYGRLNLNETFLGASSIDLSGNLLTGDIDVRWIEANLPHRVALRVAHELGIARWTMEPAALSTPATSVPSEIQPPHTGLELNLTLNLRNNPYLGSVVALTCPLELDGAVTLLADHTTCTNLTGRTGAMIFAPDFPVCSNNSEFVWLPVDGARVRIMNPSAGEEFINCTFDLNDLVMNPDDGSVALLHDIVAAVRPCLPRGVFVRSMVIKPERARFTNMVSIFFYPNTNDPTAMAEMATSQHGPESRIDLTYDQCRFLSQNVTEVCSVSGVNTFYYLNITERGSRLTFQDNSGRQKHCDHEGVLLLMPQQFSFGNVLPAGTFLDDLVECLPSESPFSHFRRVILRAQQLSFVDAMNNDLSFTVQICQNKRELSPCPLIPSIPINSSLMENRRVCTFGICATARSFLWHPCGNSPWRYEGFADLNKCISFDELLRIAADQQQQPAAVPCTMELGDGGKTTCEQELGRWVLNALTTIFDANGVPRFGATSYDNYCIKDDNTPCVNETSHVVPPNGTRQLLCDAVRFFEQPREQMMFKARCINDGTGVLLSTCDESIPITVFERHKCFGGLQLSCSACLPYIEPTATALPYAFLIISSMKDILFILVGAYFLSKPWFRQPVTSLIVRMAAALTPYNPRERDRFKQEIFRIMNPREVKVQELVSVPEEILGFSRFVGPERMGEGVQGTGWEVINAVKKKGHRVLSSRGGGSAGSNGAASTSAFLSNLSFAGGGGAKSLKGKRDGTEAQDAKAAADSSASLSAGSDQQPPTSFTMPKEGYTSTQANLDTGSVGGGGSIPALPVFDAEPAARMRPSTLTNFSFFAGNPNASTSDTTNTSFGQPQMSPLVRDAPPQLQMDFLLYYKSRICEQQKRLISNPHDPVVKEKFLRVFELFALIWRAQQETEEGRAFLHSEDFLGVRPEDLRRDAPSESTSSSSDVSGSDFDNDAGDVVNTGESSSRTPRRQRHPTVFFSNLISRFVPSTSAAPSAATDATQTGSAAAEGDADACRSPCIVDTAEDRCPGGGGNSVRGRDSGDVVAGRSGRGRNMSELSETEEMRTVGLQSFSGPMSDRAFLDGGGTPPMRGETAVWQPEGRVEHEGGGEHLADPSGEAGTPMPAQQHGGQPPPPPPPPSLPVVDATTTKFLPDAVATSMSAFADQDEATEASPAAAGQQHHHIDPATDAALERRRSEDDAFEEQQQQVQVPQAPTGPSAPATAVTSVAEKSAEQILQELEQAEEAQASQHRGPEREHRSTASRKRSMVSRRRVASAAPTTHAARDDEETPHPHHHRHRHPSGRARSRTLVQTVAGGLSRFLDVAQHVVSDVARKASIRGSGDEDGRPPHHPPDTDIELRTLRELALEEPLMNAETAAVADGRAGSDGSGGSSRSGPPTKSSIKTTSAARLRKRAAAAAAAASAELNEGGEGAAEGAARVHFADDWDEVATDDFYTKDPKRRLENQKALLAYSLRELHESAILEPIILREEVLDSRFTPQPWMLSLSLMYAVVYFLICIIQTTRIPGYTAWEQYQSIFFRYVNSGVSVSLVVNSFLRRVYLDEKTIALDPYVACGGLLLLPALFSHIIPGLLLYAWIPVSVLIVWVPACFVMRELEKEYFFTMDPVSIGFRVVFRLGMTAVMTLITQSSFNWALLFYARDAHGLDYMGVLRYEYDSRLWGCFIESRLATIANTIQFISAFA